MPAFEEEVYGNIIVGGDILSQTWIDNGGTFPADLTGGPDTGVTGDAFYFDGDTGVAQLTTLHISDGGELRFWAPGYAASGAITPRGGNGLIVTGNNAPVELGGDGDSDMVVIRGQGIADDTETVILDPNTLDLIGAWTLNGSALLDTDHEADADAHHARYTDAEADARIAAAKLGDLSDVVGIATAAEDALLTVNAAGNWRDQTPAQVATTLPGTLIGATTAASSPSATLDSSGQTVTVMVTVRVRIDSVDAGQWAELRIKVDGTNQSQGGHRHDIGLAGLSHDTHGTHSHSHSHGPGTYKVDHNGLRSVTGTSASDATTASVTDHAAHDGAIAKTVLVAAWAGTVTASGSTIDAQAFLSTQNNSGTVERVEVALAVFR